MTFEDVGIATFEDVGIVTFEDVGLTNDIIYTDVISIGYVMVLSVTGGSV